MKILITQMGHPGFRGGGNTVAHNLSTTLKARGHDVTTIFVSPTHLYKEKIETNYRLILLKQGWFPLMNCFSVLRAIRRLLEERKIPDVIMSLGYEGYFVSSIKSGALIIAASHNFIQPISFANLLNIKWLNPLNAGKFLYTFQRFLDKFTKKRADFVQALCEFGKRQCMDEYGISEEKIFIVPNGVNQEKLEGESLTSKNNILFMGGSSHHKGLDILIRALPEVLKNYPSLKVFVVGEMKKEEGDLKKLAEMAQVSSAMNWNGLVSREVMATFYKRAYLSVFPSRLDTFPLGILESMAYGIPVVATRVGGIPEIVRDGVTGVLIEHDDPNALSQVLNSLLAHPTKVEAMGKKAREVVVDKFLWDTIAQSLEREIQSRI